MDFNNAKGLLELCDNNNLSISEVMKIREFEEGISSKEEIKNKMKRVLEIMRDSATMPVNTPMKSMGGLIGGEAGKLNKYREKSIGGVLLNKAIFPPLCCSSYSVHRLKRIDCKRMPSFKLSPRELQNILKTHARREHHQFHRHAPQDFKRILFRYSCGAFRGVSLAIAFSTS